MVQKHFIAERDPVGETRLFPMKTWLRENPHVLGESVSPSQFTSHQLRGKLFKLGWNFEERPGAFVVFPPDLSTKDLPNRSDLSEEDLDEDEHYQSDELTFTLEHQLRDFLAANIEGIEVGGRNLSVYIDARGEDGVEYSTDVGFIDLLAIDENGDFVVFELKRASAPDRALGQLLRYMGWVKATIAGDHRVSGVIVAKHISEKLKYAASITPNVSLFRYRTEFQLLPDGLSC